MLLAPVIGQWWILIPVLAVDLIATAAVMGVMIWMLADAASPARADGTPSGVMRQGESSRTGAA